MSNEREPISHPEGLSEREENVVNELLSADAIMFGSFKMKIHETHPEAPLSPYYINLRMLPRLPYTMADVAKIYSRLSVGTESFDACMGIPEAGNPIATAFSMETKYEQIYLRKEEKVGHGIPGNFLTPVHSGEKVLLIDDLITGGESKFEAIEAVERAELKVKDIIVLIDRQQGGVKELADRGYTLHAAMTFSQILEFSHRIGAIDDDKYRESMAYFEANKV